MQIANWSYQEKNPYKKSKMSHILNEIKVKTGTEQS